jgi:PadR family transcriptional regulator PadR
MVAPRMTIPTQLVLGALLEGDESYGAELGVRTHLPSGTVHPILARLEGLAWVESHWEDVDPSTVGRPARRYYRLTLEGRSAAKAALDRVSRQVRLLSAARLVRSPS